MSRIAKHPNLETVSVSLVSSQDGGDGVAIRIAGGEMLVMTPVEARRLATSLITVVNRAEVKASLSVSSNLWRRQDETKERLSYIHP